MIELVSATRLAEKDFRTRSALGQSLHRLEFDRRLSAHLTFSNGRGLPDVFNTRILAPDSEELLIFIHDDVWIDDFFLADRVIEGLRAYDVIGVAGNKRRVPGQPSWAFVDTRFDWDDLANLSGAIAHAPHPFGTVSHYGPSPCDCELLDGAFIAARRSALIERGVLFDPQFDFHFYDLDFCRSARQKGLRLGTWPICVTHQSGGAFRAEQWRGKYQTYLAKWRD